MGTGRKSSAKMSAGGSAIQCRANPRIALLVHELHLGTQRRDFGETNDHIRLIGICKNVESLSIHGYNKYPHG